MNNLILFIDTFLSTIRDVLPIVVIIFGFQFAVLKKPIANLPKVILGFFYVILGLSLFLKIIISGLDNCSGVKLSVSILIFFI